MGLTGVFVYIGFYRYYFTGKNQARWYNWHSEEEWKERA
jgi:hypothetical protein